MTKNIETFSGKKSEERTSKQKKIERVTGLGRRTREERAKWNQMTALRFQTGGETSDIPGLPLRAEKTKLMTNNISGINKVIKVNGQKLETVTSFKYLGSVITQL